MFLARIGLAALAASGLYWSLRLAYADDLASRGNPSDLRRAIALTPGNSVLWARLDSTAGYEQACRLQPWNSAALIRRGLDAELHGSVQNAEALLLEAVQVDRTFAPAWTLANFYARQTGNRKVWAQVRACLNVANRDPGPVFDLCWRVSEDAGVILRAVPPHSRGRYLAYLIDPKRHRSRPEAAGAVYASLDPDAPRDAAVLLDYCDFLIANNSVDAVAPWNAAGGQQLRPELGVSMINGDLSSVPGGRGFDWHLPVQAGILSSLFRSSATMRFVFDGEQQESAELFWQTLPLVSGRRYRFQFRFQTAGVAAASGLRWCVPGSCGQDLHGNEWSGGKLDFETPIGQTLARISLHYKRAPGAMRLKGSLGIAKLSLSFRP
ncbi:MAG: hypothetical protein M3Z85_18590 [Acidobacteriota bacterium]|nr:hypothetical protein [Acidobacteriota bacterium]